MSQDITPVITRPSPEWFRFIDTIASGEPVGEPPPIRTLRRRMQKRWRAPSSLGMATLVWVYERQCRQVKDGNLTAAARGVRWRPPGCVTKPSWSRALRRLEAGGYLYRVDPAGHLTRNSGGRTRYVLLTPEGITAARFAQNNLVNRFAESQAILNTWHQSQ